MAIVAVICIVLLGGLAAIYFLVLNKSTEATGPEKTIVQYFDAMSTGDTAALKALFTPEAAPDEASLSVFSQLFGTGMIKYEDVKLKTLSETATDAEVEISDVTMVMSVGGQTVKQKLSETGGVASSVKLKNLNGAWLICETAELPGGTSVPIVPDGGTIAPSGG